MVAIDAGARIPAKLFATVKAVDLGHETEAGRVLPTCGRSCERLRGSVLSEQDDEPGTHQGGESETTENLAQLRPPCSLLLKAGFWRTALRNAIENSTPPRGIERLLLLRSHMARHSSKTRSEKPAGRVLRPAEKGPAGLPHQIRQMIS
jgi:hypothetical protein